MSKLISNSTATKLNDLLRKSRTTTATRRTRTPFIGSNTSNIVGVVACKTTGSGSADTGYGVEIYANGMGAPKTGTGKLFIMEIHAGATVKNGDWFLGFQGVSVITGGA